MWSIWINHYMKWKSYKFDPTRKKQNVSLSTKSKTVINKAFLTRFLSLPKSTGYLSQTNPRHSYTQAPCIWHSLCNLRSSTWRRLLSENKNRLKIFSDFRYVSNTKFVRLGQTKKKNYVKTQFVRNIYNNVLIDTFINILQSHSIFSDTHFYSLSCCSYTLFEIHIW